MRRPILLFLYALMLLILILYYLNPFGLGFILDRKSKLSSLEGEVTGIEGTVQKVQIRESYCAVFVKTKEETVLVRVKNFQDEQKAFDLCGRRVFVQGLVSLPSGRRNPGCFDYSLYLKGQGIYTIMDSSVYRIRGGEVKSPLLHFLAVSKASFYEKTESIMGDDEFSIMAGLMFGDKYYLDDDLYSQFQTNGIAHVLAVSGLHVGLLYSVIKKLFKGKSYLTSAITLALIYCYAALSSFSVSVLRASCMILLDILAFHSQRRYDMVTAASVTAIIFLLINPYQLFDSGFQLSFTAAYTLGMSLPWIKNKALYYSRKYRKNFIYDLLMTVLPSIFIHIGLAPLLAFHFLNYSLVSLFINPFAIALSGLILPFGLLMYVLSFIFRGGIFNAAALPESVLCRALKILNEIGTGAKLSGSVCAPPFGLLVLFYVFFFYFLSETRYKLNRQNKEAELAKLCAGLFSLALCLPFLFGITDSLLPWKYNNCPLTFVDVGQGDCTHINAGGLNILIDGGGSYYKNVGKDTVKPYLLKNGVRSIDLAIITHTDQDHSKGIYELSECFDVKNILEGGKDNNDCLISGIDLDGFSVIFMADADIQREQQLLAAYPGLSADLIKLGHHGSKTSSSDEFMKSLSPKFALISCGLNNSYGHPSSRVVELLDRLGIIYGRTDLDGAVSVIKINDEYLLLRNARKDKYWLIPRDK